MSATDLPAAEEADLGECDGEKVVTMMDVLQEQQEFEEDANAVLGASDDKNCTYPKGYIKRQAIYACLTCCPDAKTDPTKRAGVCLACSLSCHENHELVELYTKRNFCCDCGNPKFNSHPCQFLPQKPDMNENNQYNQNFSGLYCICQRPYPDPDATFEDEMIQCIVCEDWLHAAHLEATLPPNEQYSEMICKACMQKNEFLYDYSNFAVNVDSDFVDTINGTNTTISNGSVCNGDSDDGEAKNDLDSDLMDSKSKPKDDNDSKELNTDVEMTRTEGKKSSNDNTESEQKNESELAEKAARNLEQMEQDDVSKSADMERPDQHTEENKDSTNIDETTLSVPSEASKDEMNDKADKQDVQDESKELRNNDEPSAVIDTDCDKVNDEVLKDDLKKPEGEQPESSTDDSLINKEDADGSNNSEKGNCDSEISPRPPGEVCGDTKIKEDGDKSSEMDVAVKDVDENNEGNEELNKKSEGSSETTLESKQEETKIEATDDMNDIKDDVLDSIDKIINDTEDKPTEVDTTENKPNDVHDTEAKPTDTGDSKDEPANSGDSEDKPTGIGDSVDKPADIVNSEDKPTDKDDSKDKPSNICDPEDKPADIGDTENKFNEGDDTDNVNSDISEKEQNVLTNGTLPVEEVNNANDDSIQNDVEMKDSDDIDITDPEHKEELTESIDSDEKTHDNKRKLNDEDDTVTKKPKLDDSEKCFRPKDCKRKLRGAAFWPSNFRQKLCTCNTCITMYRDLSVLYLTDYEDTVTAYETLGKEKTDGVAASQYEKGLQALSSLDRIQQINALTEYNRMRDKLLEFLKSFKDRKEIVKEEDIKAFFAGMKPKREPDGVYFCR